MKRYLNALADDKTPRSNEEYFGAFTESLKMIMHQNPVERLGNAVLLAAKTAMRIKATNPLVKEFAIANHLKEIARSTRLVTILGDLTPEEKRIIKMGIPRPAADVLPKGALKSKGQAPAATTRSKKKSPSRARG